MNNTEHHFHTRMELYSDEVHDILKRSSIEFQLFCFGWIVLVFGIVISLLTMITIPVKQDVVAQEQVVTIERRIPLYQLFIEAKNW